MSKITTPQQAEKFFRNNDAVDVLLNLKPDDDRLRVKVRGTNEFGDLVQIQFTAVMPIDDVTKRQEIFTRIAQQAFDAASELTDDDS